MMESLMPLLMVALLIWFGVFAFILFVDRRVSALERRVADAQSAFAQSQQQSRERQAVR